MPKSLSRVLIHLVFSTKNRQPFIGSESQPETFAYLAGTLNAIDCPAILVGGMPDHVHLLFVLGRVVALSQAVEEVKKESSKWAKTHVHPDFYWQSGYGAFSVSPSNVPKVTQYIANQETHHQKMSFQDEMRAFLRRHELECDERYMWD